MKIPTLIGTAILAVELVFVGGLIKASATADPKVVLCHHTSSDTNTWVTIEVAQSAVDAHITNHGDTLGACVVVETPVTPPTTSPAETPLTTTTTVTTPTPSVNIETPVVNVEIRGKGE